MAAGTAEVGGGEDGVVSGALGRSAIALLLFNMLDGLFTTVYLQLNLATEANPLMRIAHDGSPMTFMVSKLMMVNVGLFILATHSRFAAARAAVHGAAVLYAGIVAYHLAFLVRLVA